MPRPYLLFPAALLALTLARPALAQQAPPDSARFYAHKLGLTASPAFSNLFSAHRVLPLGLLYKYQPRPHRAWRARLTGYFSRHDTASAGGARFLSDTNKGADARVWEVNLFVGYEWQHRLGRRWLLTYGLEAGPGYRSEHRAFSTSYYYPSGAAGPYTYTETGSRYLYRWQVQGRGLMGLNYTLTSRVSLFAETAIVLTYNHQKNNGNYKSFIDNPNYSYTPGGIYSNIINSSIRPDYYPVQVLGLAACF